MAQNTNSYRETCNNDRRQIESNQQKMYDKSTHEKNKTWQKGSCKTNIILKKRQSRCKKFKTINAAEFYHAFLADLCDF